MASHECLDKPSYSWLHMPSLKEDIVVWVLTSAGCSPWPWTSGSLLTMNPGISWPGSIVCHSLSCFDVICFVWRMIPEQSFGLKSTDLSRLVATDLWCRKRLRRGCSRLATMQCGSWFQSWFVCSESWPLETSMWRHIKTWDDTFLCFPAFPSTKVNAELEVNLPEGYTKPKETSDNYAPWLRNCRNSYSGAF